MKKLTPAERLIVAADFRPIPYDELKFLEPFQIMLSQRADTPYRHLMQEYVRWKVLTLANSLKGTGVYLKVNSALRACGHSLIREIQDRGLRVFADLKLHDIPETLTIDGMFLHEAKPEILTVVCTSGVDAMKALKAQLPDTEVLGITVLTSFSGAEVDNIYHRSIPTTVCCLAEIAQDAGLDGWIASPHEAEMLRTLSDTMTINTPGIRPVWANVASDDQKRIMTPAEAIKAGADRIVVGRPIVKAEKPYDAVMRTIEEIASATA